MEVELLEGKVVPSDATNGDNKGREGKLDEFSGSLPVAKLSNSY